MKKIYKILISILTVLVLVSNATAWGDITHEVIDSKLRNVPALVIQYQTFTKGGGIGPDIFFFVPGKEYYGALAHTVRTGDLPRKMLEVSNGVPSYSAFSYGWMTHAASDAYGHRYYVNPRAGTNSTLHTYIEIGVDSNLVDKTSLQFSVPYVVIQKGYRDIYGTVYVPSYWTILSGTQNTAIAIYVEKYLIKAGYFNGLKNKYNDFWPVYYRSINYSQRVINNPSILPNANLFTGYVTNINQDINQEKTIDIDRYKIRDIAIKLKEKGIVEVNIKDDKVNKVFEVEEPVIKNKKAFEEIISKFKNK